MFDLNEIITLVSKTNTGKTKLDRDGDQWMVKGVSEFRREPSALLVSVKTDTLRWVVLDNDRDFGIVK